MRFDIDRTLKMLVIIILAAVVGYAAWQIIQRVLYPLELFLMASIVAFILSPLVQRLHQGGVPKPLAILMVYIGLLGAMSLLGYFLINPLVDQITTLATQLPQRVNDLQPRLNSLNQWLNAHNLPNIDKLKTQASNYTTTVANTAIANIQTLVLTSFNFLVNIVLVLVIAFYLLLDGEQLKDRLYKLVPDNQLSRVAFVDATINQVLGGYLRGQLLMSLTIGTLAGVGTEGLGVAYPVVVGVLAGILELVPMLGPWLASMPALAIALFTPHPWPLVLWVGLYFLIIQQLESNVIGPRITGHAVGLHPLGALMALLVGIELDGILGALFAVPVTGILYVITMAIYYHFTGRQQPDPVQRRTTTPVLWNSLSNAEIVRTLRARLPENLQPDVAPWRTTRTTTRVFPRRLAQVEELRDALVRDKMQQRHMTSDPVAGGDDSLLPPDSHTTAQEPGDVTGEAPEPVAGQQSDREPAAVH